ncbi:MAG: 10 kDa chaperonin [candidate division WS6 bacterium GW2011_GWA2_37_6]|uniref:Co-chaperonin GroES n=1 Tax=candidate division WS6 bacterium GW2011_GWA2_37_6 TaxID=1619087 RepID=A0A0G0JDH3_9BACT|nr:MAG: 10 kDa chaperonin [candidate division WS6 bacterium GW2011_GWA2_37_6]
MAKTKIKPIGANILVKPVDEEKKTVTGIVLPDTVDKEKPQTEKVVAGKKVEFNVKVGDTVLFKKYSPDEIEIDDENYLIMTEDDILAVMA